ncbi:MAG: hypothetical protein KDC85_14330 [Saprospiraceae bacterium]|nr:hypothetical protein [Saprospiraceae bacterium]MCB9324275.1 hypothetical protein [Lewinellaceae bacterium]
MFLKWALAILLGYFVYKRYIALPPGEDKNNDGNLNRKNHSNSGKADDDDYIDFEEID